MGKDNGNATYTIEILGKLESPIRGGVPADIDLLLEKPKANVDKLYFQITQAAVESALQAGEMEKAKSIVEEYEAAQQKYNNPLCKFKEDRQNGNAPYIGAHAVFGAIRDAAKFVYPEFFFGGKKVGKAVKPSKSHFRKFVQVFPYHIHFHRPKYSDDYKNIIKKVDGIENQHPGEKVPSFGRYEFIDPPAEFYFKVLVSEDGPFYDLLSDETKMKIVIRQAVNHRLGSCRSAGYGFWSIKELSISG